MEEALKLFSQSNLGRDGSINTARRIKGCVYKDQNWQGTGTGRNASGGGEDCSGNNRGKKPASAKWTGVQGVVSEDLEAGMSAPHRKAQKTIG